MIRFQNLYYDSFLKLHGTKKIIIYGTGGTFQDFLNVHREKIELLASIELLLDSDSKKRGRSIQVGSRYLTIKSLESCKGQSYSEEEYVLILALANQYVPEALELLDRMDCFDGVSCLYGLASLSWGWEGFYPPYPTSPLLPQTEGLYQIPQRIHYCWFGGSELPEKNRRCVESWKENCPEYEFFLWDESQIDMEKMPLYVREAYQAGKFAFVSDYVRLWAVYHMEVFILIQMYY